MLVGVAAWSALDSRRAAGSNGLINSAFGRAGRTRRLLVTLLPYAVVPAVAALVWHTAKSKGDDYLAPGVYIGALCLLATLLIRQALAIAENERLASQMQSFNEDLELSNAALAEARDRALSATRSKSTFFSAMSVEIKRPVIGLTGLTDRLLETDLGGPQRGLAEDIKSSCQMLMRVLDEILDYTRIDSGKLKLEKAPFELSVLIDDVGAEFALLAQRKGIKLEFRVSPGVPVSLEGDSARLRQILSNLLRNAIAGTSAGEVALAIGILGEATDHVALRVEVSDTGTGVPKNAQSRLFHPLWQACSSSEHRYGDTRLGLAICRQLVIMMGGSIGIESAEGCGSTLWFTVKLPCKQRNDQGDTPTVCPGIRVLAAGASRQSERPAA
jgi:signal transduction histidine kinase